MRRPDGRARHACIAHGCSCAHNGLQLTNGAACQVHACRQLQLRVHLRAWLPDLSRVPCTPRRCQCACAPQKRAGAHACAGSTPSCWAHRSCWPPDAAGALHPAAHPASCPAARPRRRGRLHVHAPSVLHGGGLTSTKRGSIASCMPHAQGVGRTKGKVGHIGEVSPLLHRRLQCCSVSRLRICRQHMHHCCRQVGC